MELQHRFTVPAGVEETWATFNDIEGVAGCFPGAVVTEADAESFKGTVKVKLGPIALVYNGTGTFVEKDEATHRLVIDAKGKDKRGNGTAGAMVTATMTEAAGGATDVEVSTDLNITGKAAQFGRGGVIQDVSDKLLGQFVACLEQRLTSEPAPAPQSSPEEGSAPAPPPEDATSSTAPAPAPAPRPTAASSARNDDALDLGAAVLPVLARAYWKPVAGVLAAIAVIWWLVARDRGGSP
ncbi:MAG: SRPBCC family protein [Nocardioides sp.]